MHFNINKKANELLLWENAGRLDLLSVGYTINNPVLLFRKIEDEEVALQITKLQNSKIANNAASSINKSTTQPIIKSEISFDDFAKMDLRIGTIIEAEKVPKADKLLKLKVDIGSEQRTVVSGIAQHFQPEEIIGQQVTLLCNLTPRKMKGIESQGMILMTEDADGKLKFMMPNSKTENGSGVS
jgi:methionyl-tRNA synthetase